MIRIFLVLLLLALAFYAIRAFQKASPAKVAGILRVLFFSALVLIFLFLEITGRLNGLFAIIFVMVAFAFRKLPQLVRYVPCFHRLWQEFVATKQSSQQNNGRNAPKGTMSKEEAYEVLGLKPGATEQEIIAAHRKLMQKIHPDRGGSDYLAAKINLAKKILLNK